jgi:hypothetical protein
VQAFHPLLLFSLSYKASHSFSSVILLLCYSRFRTKHFAPFSVILVRTKHFIPSVILAFVQSIFPLLLFSLLYKASRSFSSVVLAFVQDFAAFCYSRFHVSPPAKFLTHSPYGYVRLGYASYLPFSPSFHSQRHAHTLNPFSMTYSTYLLYILDCAVFFHLGRKMSIVFPSLTRVKHRLCAGPGLCVSDPEHSADSAFSHGAGYIGRREGFAGPNCRSRNGTQLAFIHTQ